MESSSLRPASGNFPDSYQLETNIQNEERIEILPVSLLEQNKDMVEDLKKLAHSLHLEFGWHYLLDLSWTIRQLGTLQGKMILDAGAGTGILQWYLAQQGAEVISVDRMDRALIPLRFRKRFQVKGMRAKDMASGRLALREDFVRPVRGSFIRRWGSHIIAAGRDLAGYLFSAKSPGSVTIYHQDLSNLDNIPNSSVDAVVSISALEHNSPEDLELVVRELMRVIKPGGFLAATLTAAHDKDWWHEASHGWCYSDSSLRRIFDLPENTPSNYDLYDELFTELKESRELRDNLARFYRQASDKGMPNGIWNPEYQPVGVYKAKKVE